MKKNEVKKIEPTAEEFANLVSLLAVYSEASNRLETLQSDCNGQYLELIDDHKTEYAALQDTLTRTELALEMITLKHPEWFTQDKRSIKTPYGTAKFHKSTKLQVQNEEVTILRLKLHATTKPEFKVADFICAIETLNIEALEKLSDAELLNFGITRDIKNNFSVVPAKVDMGKAVAVKAEAEQEAA